MSLLAAVDRVAAIAAAAVRGWTQGWRGAEPPREAEAKGLPWTALEEQRRQIRDATTLYKVPSRGAALRAVDSVVAAEARKTLHESVEASPRCPNCGTLAVVCRAVQADAAELCCALCACAGRK